MTLLDTVGHSVGYTLSEIGKKEFLKRFNSHSGTLYRLFPKVKVHTKSKGCAMDQIH